MNLEYLVKLIDEYKKTCGIVNFEPEVIKKLMPEDILEMVGERLKEGKHEKKGQIYS